MTMISLHPARPVNRRQLLKAAAAGVARVGMAGAIACTTPLGRQAHAARPVRDRSCIFIWLNGGPSQFETFDPKPRADDDVRGPFGAIATSVPGIHVSELLPLLAQHIDKYAIVRSLAHNNADHASTAMLTGNDGSTTAVGAVVAKLLGPCGPMPAYFHIGSSHDDGSQFPSSIDAVGGGELGSAYAPVRVRAPARSAVKLGSFALQDGLTPARFEGRRRFLGELEPGASLAESKVVSQLADQRERAAEMLTSTHIRDAFDLSGEAESLRYRYGPNFFGQSCLLARRLVEAGTRFVQIKWYDVVAFDAWDCHGADLPGMSRMENQLCPRLDLGLSALLEDLQQRGLLESTLVVVVGEFGRTPTLNKNGARDHWPFCYSAVVAGAGIQGGMVVGESDPKGAYPATDPIRPASFAATIYQRLGIDTATDLRIRPFTQGALPVRELVG